MTISWIRDIFGLIPSAEPRGEKATGNRVRLHCDSIPPVVYAVGDVHGCLDLLLSLEGKIAADCNRHKQAALIIMLGDYVDRGPNASGVISHLLDPPNFNAERVCLTGNHEEIMLAFLESPKRNLVWLEFGGRQTLMSYGVRDDEIKPAAAKQRKFFHKINSVVPYEHIQFLKNLPILARYSHHVFVHAGLRSGRPLEQQTDRDLVWIRNELHGHAEASDLTVVHGHTTVERPFVSSTRINVDTAAYMTGRLTAAKIVDGKFSEIIST